MPWCGDWYLWCLFALHYDVGYFAEPMVCYREQHVLSMTHKLMKEKLDACAEEIRIPWSIRKEALKLGYLRVAQKCLGAVAHSYARAIASERYRTSSYSMNFKLVEESLRRNTTGQTEREWILARVYASVGNEYYWQGEMALAKNFYERALKREPWMVDVQIKKLLLSFGRQADYVRKMLLSLR